MSELKRLFQNGGLFRFSNNCSVNPLKEFMTFSKYAGYRGRFPFTYVEDKIHFESDITIKEFLFRELTNDLEKFDCAKALEERNASHLNEFLFKRYDLEDPIKQVDYETAKLFSILKSFLCSPQKMVFIHMDKISFTPGLNERMARIMKREVTDKKRSIIVSGDIPQQWESLLVAQIKQGPRKNFHIISTSVDDSPQDDRNYVENTNKHAA